jgi:hypothetical protein
VADGEERGALWARAVGPFVTVAALALVAVHLIWSHVRIDSVTLVLLAAAALPWLGALFKSIELPGGLGVEYRDVKRQVRTLASRVDAVEDAVFVGFTPQLETKLRGTLHSFHAFLAQLGLVHGDEPQIRRSGSSTEAGWDPSGNEILLGDPDVLCKDYAHHALQEAAADRLRAVEGERGHVEAGLSDYLVCSFKGDPLFAPIAARRLRAQIGPKEAIRNLANDRRFSEITDDTNLWDAGEVWGGALWELRDQLHEAADRGAVAAWRATEGVESIDFARQLLVVLGDRADVAREIFERRGLELGS